MDSRISKRAIKVPAVQFSQRAAFAGESSVASPSRRRFMVPALLGVGLGLPSKEASSLTALECRVD